MARAMGRTHVEHVARQPFEIIESKTVKRMDGPAVVMVDPKYPTNVASMIRNCAAFGIEKLVLTGERIDLPTGKKGSRLPRQERMREYRTVKVFHSDFPLTLFQPEVVPVCVELLPTAVDLPLISDAEVMSGDLSAGLGIHTDQAVYILGPEDGAVPAGLRACCTYFVKIPTLHCLNVAQAGGIVLYDRVVSRWRAGLDGLAVLEEHRGVITT